MSLNQFISRYNGKEVDTDGAYGGQLNTPIFNLGFLSSLNGIIEVLKTTKIDFLVINFNVSLPSLPRFIPIDTINTRGVVGSYISIPKISRVFANSKIFLAIVKSIVINMIHILPLTSIKNKTVQLNQLMVNSLLSVKYISHFCNAPHTAQRFGHFIIGVVKQYIKDSVFFTLYSKNFHLNSITGVNQ